MAIVSDVEIRLRADIARLQQDMTQARRSVDNAMGGITRAAEQAKLALFGLFAGAGLGGIGRMVDEYAKFTAQLKLASQSQREYAAGYADVKRIATQSTQGLQQTGVLYARIANGTRELGVAQKQVAAITETVNLALLVSGATADEAASAQLQLSQAFASGTLRGEEFNAVNEAAPRLMLALADGIGVPVGALKKMAEEGQITSKIMADVLPNALTKLREEAKEVQTIAGAFTVLKNEVMEFVGVQAQANGVVAGISGGLTVLAQNLGLVAGAVAVITGARLVAWLSSVAGGALSAAAANRALLVSNLEVARAEATATAQASALAGARLAEVRAATLAATGNVQLALTTNGLIPAQARATATTLAHDLAMTKLAVTQRAAALSTAALAAGTTALNGVLALTGGPIGLIITLLGAAALAWNHYGNKAKEAAEKAKGETVKSTQEIVDGLTKQNDKLRERLELSKLIGKDAAQRGGEDVDRLATLNKDINDKLRDINAGFNKDPNARTRVIELQYEYTALANAMEKVAGTQSEIATGTRAQELAGWYAQNGSKTQKMEAELEELRKKFGQLPPEMEKLVRAKYAEKDLGADAIKQATKAAQEYIASLKEQAQTIGFTAEQQRMHTAAQAAAQAPTAALRQEIMEQAVATNAVVKANEAAAESQKAYQKMLEDSGALEKEMAGNRADAVKAARDEVKANQELAATFGMSEAAIARLEVTRLREQLAQRVSVGMTLDEIEHLEQLIELKEQSASAIATRDRMAQEQEFWTDLEKTAHDTFMSIEDGGKGMWQRIKDTAKNTFFNWLYQMTVKKWIINIQTSTSGGSALGTVADMMNSGGNGGGGVSSYLSMGKSIYDGFASGFSSVGAGIGTYVSALGNTMGSSAVSAFGSGMGLSSAQAAQAAAAYNGAGMAGTGSAISAGSMAGSVASVAAGAAIGHFGGRAISNGFSAAGGSGNSLVNAGTAAGGGIGFYVGGPLGAAVGAALGGVIGGAMNRAFGHKAREYEDPVLSGSLGAGGAAGAMNAKWIEKGGWFRSDKRGTETEAINKEMSDILSGGFNAIKDVTVGFAKVFGESAEVVAGYSKTLNLTVTKDAAKNEAMLAELFTSIGEEMAARVVPNIAKFQRAGETAAQTLERLAGSFQVVEGMLTTLGVTSAQAFRATGIASIEARERVVALAGGIESLAAQTQFFADNFMTTAQQIAPLQHQVNEQLAALGYAGIFTATQFRVAVEDLARSGALATEEGAKAYAGLLALAPGFKTLTDYLLEIKRADADAAMQNLQRAVDAQRKSVETAYESVMAALRTRLDGVGDSIERMTDLSQALKGSLVGVEAPAAASAARQVADAEIATALAIAKARGVLPSVDDLRDALDAVGRTSSDEFVTLVDYQRAVARSNAQLNELGGLTDAQLGTAELQLRALEAQQAHAETAHVAELGRLDAIMANAQLQLDAANNINFSVMAVGDAVTAANAAIRALNIANGGYGGVAVPSPAPTIPVVAEYPQSGTIPAESGLLAELRRMSERLGNIETSNNQMAADNAQLTRQFNDVTAGGNALLTESV